MTAVVEEEVKVEVGAEGDDHHADEDHEDVFNDSIIKNLLSIRSILESSLATSGASISDADERTPRRDSECDGAPLEGRSCESSVVYFIKRTEKIDRVLEVWRKSKTSENVEEVDNMSVDTCYGKLKTLGHWEGEPIIALDVLEVIVKKWNQIVDNKNKTTTTTTKVESVVNEGACRCDDISMDLRLNMSDLLVGSGIVARVEKNLAGDSLSDHERIKRKGNETRYKRLLGKTLNEQMRGVNVRERYVNAELKASLAVGTGHLTGLVTMFLLGYYISSYFFPKEHIGRWISGVIAIVLFLFMEATLFIFRESRIQRTIQLAERRQKGPCRRSKEIFTPPGSAAEDVSVDNKPSAVLEKESIEKQKQVEASKVVTSSTNKAAGRNAKVKGD
eukprot:GHVH01008218.1.p1 GENE.GHVH01008218.1~~GHVH01008218.1.p1  ORF type:complete len:390 (+),score=67.47 GHVH01008218.1:83-1252(+)